MILLKESGSDLEKNGWKIRARMKVYKGIKLIVPMKTESLFDQRNLSSDNVSVHSQSVYSLETNTFYKLSLLFFLFTIKYFLNIKRKN